MHKRKKTGSLQENFTEVVGPYFFYVEVYRLHKRIIVDSHHSSRLPTLQMITARQLEEAPQRSRCIGSQALPTMQKQKDTRRGGM